MTIRISLKVTKRFCKYLYVLVEHKIGSSFFLYPLFYKYQNLEMYINLFCKKYFAKSQKMKKTVNEILNKKILNDCSWPWVNYTKPPTNPQRECFKSAHQCDLKQFGEIWRNYEIAIFTTKTKFRETVSPYIEETFSQSNFVSNVSKTNLEQVNCNF